MTANLKVMTNPMVSPVVKPGENIKTLLDSNYNGYGKTAIELKKASLLNINPIQRFENHLTKNGVSLKKIKLDDVEFAKDVACLKIGLGLIAARKHEEEFENAIEIIDNFNYKLELKKTIDRLAEKLQEFSTLFDSREIRMIKIFKDPSFVAYVEEFEKFTKEIREDDRLINIEKFALLLISTRFKNTDYRKVSTLGRKHKGVKKRRILHASLRNFLTSLNLNELEKTIDTFSKTTDEYILAGRIIERLEKLKTNIRRV